MSSTAVRGGQFEWPDDPGGNAVLMRGQAAAATPPGAVAIGEPVVAVPDGAVHITSDATVSPGAVAVAPDGTVINAGVDGAVVTTSDGVEITLDADGSLTVDSDFSNDPGIDDHSTLAPGAILETSSGTAVARHDGGSILVHQANGQRLTIHPDGSIDVVVPSDDSIPDSVEDPGDGSIADPDPGIGDDPLVEPDPESAAVTPSEEINPAGGAGSASGGGGMPTGGGGSGSGGGGNGSGGGGGGGDATGDTTSQNGEESTGTDGPTSNGDGSDFTVDLSDLRDDAAHFDDLVGPAQTLAACWQAAGPLVQHWGLWSLGAPAYREGCDRLATLSEGASVQMGALADGLRQSADDYEQQEAAGVAISGTINQ